LNAQVEARKAERADRLSQRNAARKRTVQNKVQSALERAKGEGVADLQPKLTQTLPPKYPREMLVAGIPGEVIVSFVVGSDGEVQDAKAVKSTRSEFEPAAEEAVLGWQFEPGIKNLRPVNTRLEVPMKFSLPDAKLPAGELKPVDLSGGTWLQ
jgi:TonB family protein